MTRTSLSLAGGLAAALLLVTAPGAQAAVTGKDAPNEKDIVKAFPELAGAQFTTDKVTKIGLPGKTCEQAARAKVKSGRSTTGSSATVYPIVVTAVVEFKTEAKAKSYMASYRRYVKKCAAYTQPETGASVTVSKGKSFRFGDESLTFDSQSTFSTSTNYSGSVLTRDGKRVATVIAVDDAPVPAGTVKPLAKVAAKKMK